MRGNDLGSLGKQTVVGNWEGREERERERERERAKRAVVNGKKGRHANRH
jgi:hypothetical protein